ncbi:enolase-phosphatase E1 [Drosophila innubila]|uniref:enolase-phosphatase E1 n=1 Tax=Drosophila innubila TaxID=198719 RepID=UPI00148C399D|nr:enolase-phosphatase E1 [Drosophila innubila]
MTPSNFTAKVVLVDIEGTTTSISFVHDVLFPYAKKNAGNYLQETWQTKDTKEIVKNLQQLPQFAEYVESLESSSDVDQQLITKFVSYLIERDLKVTPLKTLQGLIWAKGYAAGELKGHVYEDVSAAFQAWRDAGLQIAVYSSGSVAAQKLIFQHSIAGDLLPHLSAHFDTHVGHKQQSESYTKIAQSLQVEPQHVLFLTDVPGEADAARAAGMQTIILQRPGNAPLSEEQKRDHVLVDDFTALLKLKPPSE